MGASGQLSNFRWQSALTNLDEREVLFRRSKAAITKQNIRQIPDSPASFPHDITVGSIINDPVGSSY